ncbi:glycoside hydrolase [Shewanella sp. VB17]|uniref:glycoside hydrolase n=1 Tax=Shewanella sp. VB17 TaxID=2739432 RepID=UPI001566B146|nr:glycoside hydrolase [Shewanella sp. VB17]NRD74821.1 glycoside hydrolase [Shewanella sp. VB17]
MSNQCNIYTIFHLNLAFSSIETEQHRTVTQRCYWPLIKLIEEGIPLGIELTAYTLECIQKVDPNWINQFKALLKDNRCELIASGDSQIIGPLIPAEVNQHNLRLGQEYYQQILGVSPSLAYINEQAVSAGLLDVYIDAGFDAIVMEWDNPYSHNSDWSPTFQDQPQQITSASGRSIKVVWNNAIAFQKLQRYAHGEITKQDYLNYLDKVISENCAAFPLYGSDAEIFDYRPGRYKTEQAHSQSECARIEALFITLSQEKKYLWVMPSQTLSYCDETNHLNIAVSAHPISVKKQAKYNVTRWALSGRDDLRLNTHCFAKYQELTADTNQSDNDWRNLCRLWSSDYRTHLTQIRFDKIIAKLPAIIPFVLPNYNSINSHPLYQISFDKDRNKIEISSVELVLVLNANKGLNIESLAFNDHCFSPVSGTLAHGHFDHISFGADFYSNHLVLERFRERDRVTDLTKAKWQLEDDNGALIIRTSLTTLNGTLTKWYRLEGQSVQCGFYFDEPCRPEASLRLGYITLQNCDIPCWFAAYNGGYEMEYFQVDSNIDHGSPVSSIVSSNSALGATTGEVLFGNGIKGIRINWEPNQCAALPMISSKKINGKYLNRLWFSLIEADETLKLGGHLPAFCYTMSPYIMLSNGAKI